LQRELYHKDRGFLFNIDTSNTIKKVLKEKIFPKIKILSSRDPDIVGDIADQSQLICDE
jgi:hypothetical protein